MHRVHKMQTIVTDVRGVCQSVCHAVIDKSPWPLVEIFNEIDHRVRHKNNPLRKIKFLKNCKTYFTVFFSV